MSGDLWIDTRALRQAAEKIYDPNETVANALQAFYDTVNPLGPKPWGTGEIGGAFEQQYCGLTEQSVRNDGLRGHEALLASIAELSEGMGTLQRRTFTMAEEYDQINDANSQ
jgi:hypothetical protein